MSKSQAQIIQQLLKKAQKIRFNSKTSCVQLQNLLYYQKVKLSKQSSSSLMLCGCDYDKAVVKPSFKRAFKALTDIQKAQYYLKSCQIINDFINGNNQSQQQGGIRTSFGQNSYCNPQNQVIKKILQIKQNSTFAKWVTFTAEISMKQKLIRIIDLRQQVDLHYFIMRKSRNKSKKAFVLQATQEFSQPQSLRISCQKDQQYEQLQKLIRQLYYDALRHKIIRMMLDQKKYPKGSKDSNSRSKVKLMKYPMQQVQPMTCRLTLQNKKQNQKDIKKGIQQAQRKIKIDIQCYEKISQKLIPKQYLLTLNSFQNFTQVSTNIFHQKKGNKVRRLFTFKRGQISNLQWLIDQMLNSQTFHEWKPSLQFIQVLSKFPAERTYLFHQIDYYKNQMQIDYVFMRHYVVKDNVHYFVDKSTIAKIGPKLSASKRGQIKLSVWRFRQLLSGIQVLVQSDIQHGAKNQKQNKKLTQQFIGDFNQILKCRFSINSQFFQAQNQIMINTIDFQQDYISEIGQGDFQNQYLNNDRLQEENTQFYSLSGSSYQFNENKSISRNFSKQYMSPNNFHLNQNSRTSRRNKFDNVQFSMVKQNSQKQVTYNRHLIVPMKQVSVKKVLKAQNQGQHFIWKNQWKINNDGTLININQEKIKVQSSVLKLVLKRMGQNLLQGKSIMNTSLPIELFDDISLLERFSICMGYGPIFLQKAALNKSPVERLKSVIAFGIGFNICFLEMQKAFNPVLGQTFQGIIDGCPVYAQQICHHPPISSLFFQGRGYTVTGSLQPKIQMGLKSVCGKNQGFLSVNFTTQFGKSQVKFQTVAGQLSGLIYGDRALKFTQTTIFFDAQNYLFCEIKWGKSKVADQLSKYQDYFIGQLYQVDQKYKFNTNRSQFQKPKKKYLKQMLGIFRGRWTEKIYFDNQLIFDVTEQAPCILQQYPVSLQSNSNNRKDIKLRKQNMWNDAQDAKCQIQDLQRYDKKLRTDNKK